MSSVDERIVQMKFDNNQFESGVKETLNSLDNLKKGLNFQNIESGVSALQKRFSTLGIVGMEVTKRLTNAVIDTGKKMVDATLGQIKSGGMSRALNMEQARFQLEGLGLIEKAGQKLANGQVVSAQKAEQSWKAALDTINYGVQDTAYGLDAAAKAASMFGASGMSLEEMKTPLRAISGVAAMTGSSYENIADIFTTVAGNGRLMGEQLLQLSSRGLNAAATIADYYNDTHEGAKKTEKDIREMVSKGEIDFATFSAAMDSAFGQHAKDANETFTGSLANMKTALSRIVADFAQPYMKAMIPVHNATGGAIKEVQKWLNREDGLVANVTSGMEKLSNIATNVIKTLTGHTDEETGEYIFGHVGHLAAALENVLRSIFSIIKPIGSAFKEIFPTASIDTIKKALVYVDMLSFSLREKIAKQSGNLKEGYKGVFTIFKALGNAISFLVSIIKALTAPFGGIINIIGTLIGIVGKAIQRFYDWASNSELVQKGAQKIVEYVGKASQAIHDFVTNSKVLSFIGNIIGGVATGLSYLGKGIASLFKSFKNSSLFDKFAQGFAKIKEALKGFGSGKKIDFNAIFTGIFTGLDSFSEKIKKVIGFISKIDFKEVINTGMFAMLTGAILELVGAVDLLIDKTVVGKGKIIKLGSQMHSMLIDLDTYINKNLDTKKLKAKALVILAMAAALVVLVFAVKSLAQLDTEGLVKGLLSVGILFKMLNSEIDALSKNLDTKKSGDMIKTAVALLIFTSAIKSLSKSVVRLGELNWGSLIRGLVGVGALLAGLNLFLNNTDFDKISFSKGLGLLLIAQSLKSMSKAVEKLGNLNLKQLIKGLGGVAVLLTAIGVFTKISGDPKHMISAGAGMILLATSMLIFASAVKKFGNLKADEVTQGLFLLAVNLGILAAAVKIMSPGKALGVGAALIVMSVGILAIAGALKILSTISSEGIMIGLVGIIGSLAALGILAVAVNPAKLIATAAAIVIFAAGLTLLVPPLVAFGKMKLETICGALAMLAGIFLVFGVAAMALSGAILPMLGLGAAILVLGAGITVTAAGLMLLAAAFAALAVSAAAGAAALVAAITTIITGIITMIPAIGAALAEGVLNFLAVLSNGAAQVAVAATKLGMALLTAIVNLIPAIVNAGLRLIVGLMQGINSHIGAIASLAIQIVGNFILGIAAGIGTIIQAGIALMIAFINGLAQGIRDNTEKVIAAAKNMMSAVVEAILTVLQELLGKIPVIGDDISEALESAKEGVQDFFDVEEAEKMSSEYMAGIKKGIDKGKDGVGRSAKDTGKKAKESTKEGMAGMDAVSQAGVDELVNGLNNGKIPVSNAADALGGQIPEELKPYMDQLNSTGAAGSINLANGMTSKTEDVKKAAQTVRSASSGELRAAARDASTSGSTVSSNYANSMSGNQSQAKTAGAQVAKASTTEIKTAEKSASASGKSAGGSFSSSLGSPTNINSTRKSARELAYTASVSVSAYNSSFVTTGNNMAAGLESGFRTRMTRTIATIAAKAREAAQAANKGAEVRSPSRITMKTGRFIAEGLSYGMKKRSNLQIMGRLIMSALLVLGSIFGLIAAIRGLLKTKGFVPGVIAAVAGLAALIGGIATKFNDYVFLLANGGATGKLQMAGIIVFALAACCFAIVTFFTRDKTKKVKVEGEDVPVAKD